MSDIPTVKPALSPEQTMLQKRLEALKAAKNNPGRIKDVSEDFEAMFVYFMLRSMRKTVMKSGLFEGGLQGDIWESMFDQELSKSIAHSTPLGVAEMLQKQVAPQAGQGEELLPFSPIGATLDTRAIANRLKAEGIIRQSGRLQRPDAKSSSGLITDRQRMTIAGYDPEINSAARRYNLNPDLVRAVILAESGGNPQALSPRGAKGLMQLIDSTAKEMGVKDPWQPKENILGGSRYLAEMLERFDGNYAHALAAYNAGPSAVEKHQGIPPYPETRAYVQKVLQYFSQFSDLR